MSPTVPPISLMTTSVGVETALARMRDLISFVMCGITCTVAPRNSPFRSLRSTASQIAPAVWLAARVRFSCVKRSLWPMSRSVSAPSSVTNTSPCWNGLIVPGSTLRYGSNFWSWTRSPRAFSSRPSEAATIPFPRAETTPPVTKTYFGARALTGFQGSTGCGRRLFGSLPDECGKAGERLRGDVAPHPAEARRLDRERRLRLGYLHRHEIELDLGMLARQLEGDAPQGRDLEDEQRPSELGSATEARPLGALELPVSARSERTPHARVGSHEPGPPLGPARRVG